MGYFCSSSNRCSCLQQGHWCSRMCCGYGHSIQSSRSCGSGDWRRELRSQCKRCSYPLKYDDDHGHGTHVSGTVAALDNGIGVVGVAPGAKLLTMKVLDRGGSGSTSRIAEGIRSCMANGADIISMSVSVYSETSSEIMHSAIQDAAAMGIVSVAAAGNLSSYIISFPARYAEVIAVSAIDSSSNFAGFSNYGAEIDYTAPGVNVYSTTKGGKYGYMEGTSMATPHVAGTVALQISSGSVGLVGMDIGLPVEQQGLGLIDALSTLTNFN